MIVEIAKTPEEILEADKREKEIEAIFQGEDKAARREFGEATKEERELYESIWKPAWERWEAFVEPHFKKVQARSVANLKKKREALAEVRRDWRKCPYCGAMANRFQTFCTGDKCGMNLITGTRK